MRRDVVIVGGGPAGLSAALILGRCRRDVLLVDSGAYRNADAGEVHAYLTREGISPGRLRELGRAELARYDGVELRDGVVEDAWRDGDGWVVRLAGGDHVEARALLLATGVADVLPPVRGARELHGKLVFPCPYCEGWERRDQPLVAYAYADDRGAEFAIYLAQWSRELVLCTGGPATLGADARAGLAKAGIAVDERPITELVEDDGALVVRFADGQTLRRAAMFYHLGAEPRSDLAARLGARMDHHGDSVVVDRHEATSVPGLWVAGDATRDALLAIVGAGEGAAAGMAINGWLHAQEV